MPNACRIIALALLPALLLVCAAAPAGAISVSTSPEECNQWQPETDRSDQRIASTRLSLQQKQVTVQDLLARLSESSHVDLTAADTLLDLEVTAFAEDCSLEGVMTALAALFRGYWVFPRGHEPSSRPYRLVPDQSFAQPLAVWLDQYSRRYQRRAAAAARPERTERMAVYESALDLSAEQLLEQDEGSDPWLCADLLNPAVRPMIAYVYSLSDADKKRLLDEGSVAFPVRQLRPAFCTHLARWCKGEWGRPGMVVPDPSVDHLRRFETPEQRWENGYVLFLWSESALELYLQVPDTATFDTDIIRMPNPGTLVHARYQLALLGYRDNTPEYREAAEKEEERLWAQTLHSDDPPDFEYADLTPPPNQTDPRLQLPVTLDELRGAALAVADVLECAARQTGLAILSPYLPGDYLVLQRPHDPDQQPTLGSILKDMRRQRGGLLSWNFYGEYLVVTDAEHRLIEAFSLPQDFLDEWGKRLEKGGSFSVDQFASFLADLNGPQLHALYVAFASDQSLLSLPLRGLRLYGLLDEADRQRLREQEPLPLSELPVDQRHSYERAARNSHPWLESPDLSRAVLRTLPRKLSTGEDGISFIVEYHFPDSPNDRDVLFTSPLTITIPGEGPS